MIDLHTHILPGVDDGVRTDEEALDFARLAAGDGVKTIVATPHCREGFYVNERSGVLEGVARLRQILARAAVDVEVLPGAEVHVCPDLPRRIKDGRAPTLADNGKTLLLELSMTQYPVELANLVFQLKLAGAIVLFAHPERIRYFQDDVRRYEEVIRLGAFGQITTGSITGEFGSAAADFSEELLRKRLVHVIATDAHNVRGRPPVMSRGVEAAAAHVGADHALKMVTEYPRALVEGREPQLPEPQEPPPKRAFLGRLFGRNR